MWDFFEPGLKEQLSELEAETPVSRRVKSIFLAMLPSGHSFIEEVAGQLAMSPCTLQRHVAKNSLNSQIILNGTRRERAQEYLGNSTISIGETSYLLGYIHQLCGCCILENIHENAAYDFNLKHS